MSKASEMLTNVGMDDVQIDATLDLLQHFTGKYVGRYEEMHGMAPSNSHITQFQSGFLTAFAVAWRYYNGE